MLCRKTKSTFLTLRVILFAACLPLHASPAVDSENHLSVRFDEQGLTLKRSGQSSPWWLTIKLESYGQKQSIHSVPEAELRIDGRRIYFERGDITTWYVNHDNGQEQGFILNAPPPDFQPAQPVLLNLAVRGNVRAKLKADGQDLGFYDHLQHQVFTFSTLKIIDANGRKLTAQMKLAHQQIIISMNASDAVWPVRIDPLFTTMPEMAILTRQ